MSIGQRSARTEGCSRGSAEQIRSTAERTHLPHLNMLPPGVLRRPDHNANKAPRSPATHQGETTTTAVRNTPNKRRNREPFPCPQSPYRSPQIENPPHSVCVYLSLWILSSLFPIRVSVLVGALSSPTSPSRRWVFFQREASTPEPCHPAKPLEPWAPYVVSRPHRRLARRASSNYCGEALSDVHRQSDPIPDKPPFLE